MSAMKYCYCDKSQNLIELNILFYDCMTFPKATAVKSGRINQVVLYIYYQM